MIHRLLSVVTDENKRMRLQLCSTFLLLGVVAALMTLLNVISKKGSLTVVTGVFAVLCFIQLLLVLNDKISGRVTYVLSVILIVELLAMFSYFIVTGNPDGFSVIWAAMLPSCAMVLFGRKRASIHCAIMFALLVFFFWTPFGRSLLQYEYSETFMTRFPILFVAFFALPFLLESIRAVTQQELDRLRETYRYRAAHDYLTELLNRRGLEDWRKNEKVGEEQAVFMIDIDRFKRVNDSLGHDVGDLVLAAVAETTKRCTGTQVCRWGGEEFVVWFPDSGAMTDPEALRKAVEETVVRVPHCDKTVSVTVSIGVAKGSGELKALIGEADMAMLRAKRSGRNRVVWADGTV